MAQSKKPSSKKPVASAKPAPAAKKPKAKPVVSAKPALARRRPEVTRAMLEKLKEQLTQKYLVGRTRWVPERNMARSKRWKGRPLAKRHLHRTVTLDPAANIVGIGVGKRLCKGRRGRELCLIFFVTRKMKKVPKNHLLDTHLPELEGVPTDVIEVGIPRAAAASPGASIGFIGHGTHPITGTLGMYVRDVQGRVYILSNSHVIADEGRVPPGTVILSPGPTPVPGAPPAQAVPVATLTRFAPLRWAAIDNIVDCAIAELSPPPAVPPVNHVPGIGLINGVAEADRDMRVSKIGRTTGLRRGTVYEASVDMIFNYPHTPAVLFTNQMSIEADPGTIFAQDGDSGSVIINDQRQVVGLLIAVGGDFTFANHIGPVLEALHVMPLPPPVDGPPGPLA